jgi:hypothetical protein
MPGSLVTLDAGGVLEFVIGSQRDIRNRLPTRSMPQLDKLTDTTD